MKLDLGDKAVIRTTLPKIITAAIDLGMEAPEQRNLWRLFKSTCKHENSIWQAVFSRDRDGPFLK